MNVGNLPKTRQATKIFDFEITDRFIGMSIASSDCFPKISVSQTSTTTGAKLKK